MTGRAPWLAAAILATGLVAGAGTATAARAQASADPITQGMVCWGQAEAFGGAAEANARSLDTLGWTPFGPEVGWEPYGPMIAQEIGAGDCAPYTPDFAAALAAWQGRWGLPATGVFGPDSFQVFKGLWQERRPFIQARLRDECPEPPSGFHLAELAIAEDSAQRPGRFLRVDVLDAYRAMVAAARAEVPEIAADPELLTIFSGFRDPYVDAARCEAQGNCDGVRRALCSPHRTGTAVDLYVGRLLDAAADSTEVQNRLHQSRGAAYRWLVKNAGRFGFVNYVYEPWHWEYVGPPANAGVGEGTNAP